MKSLAAVKDVAEIIVVDDGSTDNTGSLIDKWIMDGIIVIQYVRKENGGMHTGHNTAYKNINTELNICIDSDDCLPVNAVESIIEKWKQKGSFEYAGIIGLDAFEDGRIVGTRIPDNLNAGTLQDLYFKHGVRGDKKLILRTDIVKKYPLYPEYPEERLVPLGILYLMIDQDYKCLYSNDVYCFVEYLSDGSSSTILKQYKQSPKGFAYSRLIQIQYSRGFFDLFKNSVHLVSSAIFAKDYTVLDKSTKKGVLFLALPFGFLVNLYIRFRLLLKSFAK